MIVAYVKWYSKANKDQITHLLNLIINLSELEELRMPFYEYACQACGHEFDIMQKISDAPLRKCPSCKRDKLQKLVSAPKFSLKGTGWYETDFKHKGKPEKKVDKEEGGRETSKSSTEDKQSSGSTKEDKKDKQDSKDKKETTSTKSKTDSKEK